MCAGCSRKKNNKKKNRRKKTKDKRQKTKDKRQKTKDKRQKTKEKRQKKGGKKKEDKKMKIKKQMITKHEKLQKKNFTQELFLLKLLFARAREEGFCVFVFVNLVDSFSTSTRIFQRDHTFCRSCLSLAGVAGLSRSQFRWIAIPIAVARIRALSMSRVVISLPISIPLPEMHIFCAPFVVKIFSQCSTLQANPPSAGPRSVLVGSTVLVVWSGWSIS